ncbi:MAG: hypothetical protein HOK21_12050 [Rhodospirillaceae bacterium]|mgnify:CR=1 FL=1|nr:hypothetical protein [Rhodospirillaceae bacterium]MBT4042834.1 hypothetical protein [Rhodospirillaceae bacterium]MBT4689913.1 hypothetical protein [Rhodospirillaceae bacterium]MBT5081978.1 hypothetical protein [Rhodospirillaceae bacterium]MBT5524814.1 hypothetical protein [Rhodospirillaceae bacterium]
MTSYQHIARIGATIAALGIAVILISGSLPEALAQNANRAGPEAGPLRQQYNSQKQSRRRPSGRVQGQKKQAGSGRTNRGPKYLPAIASRGFTHQRETARYRQRVQNAINRAKRARRINTPTDGQGLTAQQAKLVQWLQARNREVYRHEGLHYSTGQPFTVPPVYEFVDGPDGRRYAISGHVSFNLSGVHASGIKPLSILRRLHAAALAPRQPSKQDQRVAQALAASIRRLEQQ